MKTATCKCGRECKRHSKGSRRLRGGAVSTWTRFWCPVCQRHFTRRDGAMPWHPNGRGTQYPAAVVLECLGALERGETFLSVSRRVGVPISTISSWKAAAPA